MCEENRTLQQFISHSSRLYSSPAGEAVPTGDLTDSQTVQNIDIVLEKLCEIHSMQMY